MYSSERIDQKGLLIFIGAVLILICNHIFNYTGHYGYDDMYYAKLANDLMHGQLRLEDHYSFRWPTIFFTALSFKIFGISDFAASIPPLIVSICTLYFVYLILRSYGKKALLFGLMMTVLDGWSLHYSDKLMPDTYTTAAVISMMYFFSRYKFVSDKNQSISYSLGFACSLLFGFMSKEIILLTLPLFAYLFIVDIIKKRDIRFWTASILFSIFLFSIYFGIIQIIKGSALERFTAMNSNPYLIANYTRDSLYILLKRIFYEFFALLINTGVFIAPGMLIAFLIRNWNQSIIKYNDEQKFFNFSTIVLLISCSVFTALMTIYNPQHLDPRHYLFLVPIASIAVAPFLADHFQDLKFNLFLLIFFLFCTILTYFNSQLYFKFLYLPMLVLFILNLLFSSNKVVSVICPLLFVIILGLKMADSRRWAKELNYEGQKKVIMDQFISPNKDAYIITDEVQKRLGDYYNGFGIKSRSVFLKFEEFKFDTLNVNKDKYLVLNNYTQQLSNLEPEDVPYYAKYLDTTNMVFQNSDLHMSVYKLNQISEPKNILHFINDFEKIQELTEENKKAITTLKKNSGQYSNKVKEFSISFEYSTDSLQLTSKQHLLIDVKLAVWKNRPSKTFLVISIDEKDKPYIYKAHPVDHYMKAFSDWNKIKLSELIDADKIHPGSILKIYLWNQEDTDLYMDDFELNLSVL